MRKLLYILPVLALALCVALALLVTGVWTLPEPTEPSTQESTGSSQESSQPIVWDPVNMVSISLPLITESDLAEDGTVIYSHIFQDMVLDCGSAQINERIVLDLLQRMDANTASYEDIRDLAQQSYVDGESWEEYYCKILYAPTRIDKTVVSLLGTETVFTGDVRAEVTNTCVNYDLLTGNVMTLGQILTEESDAADRLCQALVEVLGERAEELYSDYADTITRRFQSDLQQEATWYFSAEGLCFYFAPYDIAPYSTGAVFATVPYSRLLGILRNDLFPGETSDVAGEAAVQWFGSANLDDFGHFSEVLLDPEADAIILSCDTIVYDVRLQLNGAESLPGQSADTVFAANCISAGDAVVIHYPFADGQQLLLTCRSGGEVKSYVISADGNALTITENDQ